MYLKCEPGNAAADSAAHAAGAASTLMEARGQAARQAETEVNLVVKLKAAIYGMNLGDTALIAALLINATATAKNAFATRTGLQALPADMMQVLAAHPSASVLLVIEMPLVLAQAIMKLARARDPGLVELGIRCCQLGEEVVPLGDEISFTKYAQELRDIPATAAEPTASQPAMTPASVPGSRGSKSKKKKEQTDSSFKSVIDTPEIGQNKSVRRGSWSSVVSRVWTSDNGEQCR